MVYFISGGGKTKVGFSTNPSGRFHALQASSPVSLRLVLTVSGGHALERRVHELLKERRSHGEWFEGEIGLDEATKIVRAARTSSERSVAGSRNSTRYWQSLAEIRRYAKSTGRPLNVVLATLGCAWPVEEWKSAQLEARTTGRSLIMVLSERNTSPEQQELLERVFGQEKTR